MKKQEKISVILPAYNAEATIERTIKSVAEQTYKNIELIVIENGKKDKTEEICKISQENYAIEIKYLYNTTPNVSKARNKGLENATGKYIAFVDSDDEYTNNFLETLVNKLEKDELQLVTCGYKTVNKKTKRLIDKYENIETTTNLQDYLETLKKNYLYNELWNKIYLNSIIKEKNIKFNEKFELGEDLIFNLNYYKWVEKAGYVNEPLYIYTVGEMGLKLKYRRNKFEIEYELVKYLEKFYIDQKYSMEYIYNHYARIYYNAIMNIYEKNNKETKKEKDERLNKLIMSEKYNSDLNYIKNRITNKKFKIVVKYIFLKGKFRIKMFILFNKIIHK